MSEVSVYLCCITVQANAFRNAHRIYVSGFDIPDPLENFQQLRDM